ncbi:hypothetical protein A3Q56_06624 [Intoshia linei]|uniref:Uncharacterized protein n=1 Tax=Intoshia linei TaxID=1819745 RepID=A0A177AUF0_9BILA|nr:hypothetical protein A3Q56_06624 [Intoshia linei]
MKSNSPGLNQNASDFSKPLSEQEKMEIEKEQVAMLKAKYGNLAPKIMKAKCNVAKGQKYFDSADYSMAMFKNKDLPNLTPAYLAKNVHMEDETTNNVKNKINE